MTLAGQDFQPQTILSLSFSGGPVKKTAGKESSSGFHPVHPFFFKNRLKRQNPLAFVVLYPKNFSCRRKLSLLLKREKSPACHPVFLPSLVKYQRSFICEPESILPKGKTLRQSLCFPPVRVCAAATVVNLPHISSFCQPFSFAFCTFLQKNSFFSRGDGITYSRI